jgi:polar amino acid transport system substrate-binding protein
MLTHDRSKTKPRTMEAFARAVQNPMVVFVCSVLLVFLHQGGLLAPASAETVTSQNLRGGWSEFRPFQYSSDDRSEGAEGFDVSILVDVLALAGMETHLHKQSWAAQLNDLIDGKLDLALGAFKPANGDDRFFYSLPYRSARLSLFIREEDKDRIGSQDINKLLGNSPDFHIGAIEDRLFQDEKLNEIIEHATRSGRVVFAENERENLQNLVRGQIDGFIGDRLGVAATALALGLESNITEIQFPGSSTVHILLSKKTVSAETLSRINNAIQSLEESGELEKRLRRLIFSVVMDFALASTMFFVLGIVGTVAFAVSGVMIAYRENFSLFGALVLSALPALGGGALRDVLFDRSPIGAVANPFNLILVVVTVLVGFAVASTSQILSRRQAEPTHSGQQAGLLSFKAIQELCDAAGLAAFTISGFAVAIAVGADPLWLWGPISAMLTAAGGGILRDTVRQSGKVSALRDSFYAEVPLLWSLGLAIFLLSRPSTFRPEEIGIATIVTLIGVFLTRLAAVFFGWKALKFSWARSDRADEL